VYINISRQVIKYINKLCVNLASVIFVLIIE